MEINVREAAKIVEVWLSQAESQDPALLEQLKPMYQHYHERKYLVAVFHSGHDDLYDLTRSLLVHNRNLSARREAAQAQQLRPKLV